MVTRSAILILNGRSNRKDKLMRIIITILATIISLLGIACAAEAPPNTPATPRAVSAVESYASACATINKTAVAQSQTETLVGIRWQNVGNGPKRLCRFRPLPYGAPTRNGVGSCTRSI